MTDDNRTPLEKVEALFQELVDGYGDGSDREARAASKLLMVALRELHQHERFRWQGIVEEYVLMLRNDRQKFERILDSNRGETKRMQP